MNSGRNKAQGGFRVLRSSAGAGKTHNLVKHYLLLALKGRDAAAYTRILALTFTTKAAAEMRERVLKYLEDLGGEGPLGATGADVRDSVMRLAGIDEAELRQRAKAMHSHMLHHWSQVAISTIDSFVRRVVKPFARELQLDHELRMTTDEEYYRGRAVEMLLEDVGSDLALTKVLVETCEQLLDNEEAWHADRPLRKLADQLGKESAIGHLEKLRETPVERFIDIQRTLRERNDATRNHLRQLGQEVMKAVAGQDLTEDDFPHKANGYIAYFRKLATLDDSMKTSERLKKAVATGTWTAAGTPPHVRSRIEALKDSFESVFREAESLRKLYTLDRAMLKDLLPMATLNSIGERLERLKQEEGVSFFSDLTRKVHDVVQEEPAPFIYERLGEWYKHFLVDEFQDTSLMQWHAMLPLVHNALSAGGTVLLVGDAKQAIYRWRNGEARQFIEFPNVFRKELLAEGEAYEAALQQSHESMEPLASNFRSGRAIIEFNNRVTGGLMEGLGEKERRMYQRHGQNAVLDMQGYVEVGCYEDGKKDVDDDCPGAWRLMKQAVRDSLEDGFQPGDIAVLVRTRKQGAEASGHLRDEGWNVVSPDGLTLGGHAACCAVIEVLAWLHAPLDEHAARAAQAIAIMAVEEDRPDPFPEGITPTRFMRDWMQEHRSINARLPLVPLITRIAIAIGHDPATDIFIMNLINEAHAFSKMNGDDLPGFLEKWELGAKHKSVGGSPIPEAIQVMTVHKAKGLQFPVVIIPDGGKKPSGNHDRIWITPDPPMEDLPTVLVGRNKDLLGIGIPEMDEEEGLGQLDDLDVLYVALTRPEQRLYISIARKEKESFGSALREMLAFDGDTYRTGLRENKRVKDVRDSGAGSPAAGLEIRPASVAGRGERVWKIRKEAPEEWDPSDPDPYRSQGKAVHAILARVRTAADLPDAIRQERDRWGLPEPVCATIAEHLRRLLALPAIAPFFRQGLEVFNEYSLLQADGSTIRPDRVVRDHGVFHVLDIKTGRAMEGHHRQVQGYTRLLQALENVPVKGWLLYAAQGELVPVDA